MYFILKQLLLTKKKKKKILEDELQSLFCRSGHKLTFVFAPTKNNKKPHILLPNCVIGSERLAREFSSQSGVQQD